MVLVQIRNLTSNTKHCIKKYHVQLSSSTIILMALSHWHIVTYPQLSQHAKKVMSNSQMLVDFEVGTSLAHKFFGVKFKLQKL